jgi:hypothetical protein
MLWLNISLVIILAFVPIIIVVMLTEKFGRVFNSTNLFHVFSYCYGLLAAVSSNYFGLVCALYYFSVLYITEKE